MLASQLHPNTYTHQYYNLLLTTDTTDVQKAVVTLKELESGNFNVTCHFLTGSDALGCMVILIGQSSNHTMKLMKRSADIVHTEELKLENKSLSCYDRIVAFDIESDGSVGTLSVPGHLERDTDRPCIASEGLPITVGQSGIIVNVIILIMTIITFVFTCVCGCTLIVIQYGCAFSVYSTCV